MSFFLVPNTKYILQNVGSETTGIDFHSMKTICLCTYDFRAVSQNMGKQCN